MYWSLFSYLLSLHLCATGFTVVMVVVVILGVWLPELGPEIDPKEYNTLKEGVKTRIFVSLTAHEFHHSLFLRSSSIFL